MSYTFVVRQKKRAKPKRVKMTMKENRALLRKGANKKLRDSLDGVDWGKMK